MEVLHAELISSLKEKGKVTQDPKYVISIMKYLLERIGTKQSQSY